MNFRPRVMAGRWSTCWTEPVQGQSLEEGRYVGVSQELVSLPMCTLKRRSRSSRLTSLGLGSAGIHFRWKWWGQQPGHKCFDLSGNQPGLDWANLRLCGRKALECKTLLELVTHTAVRLGGSLFTHVISKNIVERGSQGFVRQSSPNRDTL